MAKSIIYDLILYGEHLVKIGPVDPDIIGLKGIIKNKKRKRNNASRTYSTRIMHAARAK